MIEKSAPHTRPYWHVDAKWICGILLFFSLGLALLFYNLSVLTERDKAVTISATILASLFSKDGLDDEQGLAELRANAALLPGETVAPIPQFPWLQISKTDLLTKSPPELRIAIFRQLTEPIYDKGLGGAAEGFSANPAEQQKFMKDAALLGVFTKTTHEALQATFIIATIVSVTFLAGLIYFSAGWGRLYSPGVVLLLVSILGALLGLLLLYPPSNGNAPFANLSPGVAEEIGNSLSRSYLTAAIVGIALQLIAIIGKAVHSGIKRRNRRV